MSLETIRFEHLDLKEGMTLLDLGCGEGRHTLSAALTAPIHAVGLDMSRRDLTTARNRCGDFESLTKTENAPSLIEGDGARLPFADATFDRIICSEVLEHIHDYETFLREIRRVIKPGGLFAASVPSFSLSGFAGNSATRTTRLREDMFASSTPAPWREASQTSASSASSPIAHTHSTHPIGG